MSDTTLDVVIVPILLVLTLAVLEVSRVGCSWLVQKARSARQRQVRLGTCSKNKFMPVPALE